MNFKPYVESTPSKIFSRLHVELCLIRSRLQQLNAWPEAGDQFLALIPPPKYESSHLPERCLEWLPLVVNDALCGRDIGAQYPSFFYDLLTNSTLRRAFILELEKGVWNQ